MRSILIGLGVIAAYYALIFGYAARVRAERHEHVAWRFPLRGGSDYCADPMPNGACVCSDAGTLLIVKDGKELARFKAFESNPELGDYSPFEGYQWIGGTRDSLALVSAARPPMNDLSLYAIECSGKVRWQTHIPPGEVVTWIECSPDAIFVLTYELTSSSQRSMPVSRIHRYGLDGKQIYSVEPKISVGQLAVADDNWAYLADNTGKTIEARNPEGKLIWQTLSGGSIPIYSSYGDGKTLFYVDNSSKLHGVGRDGKELFATQLPAQSYPTPGFVDTLRMALNSGNANYMPNYNVCNLADGGGRIYNTSGTLLTCIDTAGKQLWQSTLRSSPLAIAADSKGRAYITLSSGGICCYSPDGKELWRNSSMSHFSSALSVGSDDRVLVEADGELICIKH